MIQEKRSSIWTLVVNPMFMLLESPSVGTGLSGATTTMILDCSLAEIGERQTGIVASGYDASRLASARVRRLLKVAGR